MGSTVEQDRSHIAGQVEYAGNCGRFADEARSKSSTLQVDRTSYTVSDEETQKFQEYANINQKCWNQKMAAVESLPVFDDEENESLEDDVHSFVDKTSHLPTAVFRWGVEDIQLQPLFTDHRDPSIYVTMLGECWDDTHKSRSVIKFVLRSMHV